MAKRKEHKPLTFVPCAAVSPNAIHFYSYCLEGYNYTSKHAANAYHLEDNDTRGIISHKANKKIQAAVSWLLFNAERKRVWDEEKQKWFSFRINFITLTLPFLQSHSDQEIKSRCLNNFLQILRSEGVTNYIWRAEAQPATNNIHFHITTDKYIAHQSIRKWWNQSINLLGYVDEFENKFHHNNPNSTDVHSVKKVKNIASYLSKYIGKNRAYPIIGEMWQTKEGTKEILYGSAKYRDMEGENRNGKLVGHVLGTRVRNIEGKLWGCSYSLAGKKNLILDSLECAHLPLIPFCRKMNYYTNETQYVRSYYGNIGDDAKEFFPELYQLMQQFSQS